MGRSALCDCSISGSYSLAFLMWHRFQQILNIFNSLFSSEGYLSIAIPFLLTKLNNVLAFEYPQHMLWLRNKKKICDYALLSGGLTSALSLKRPFPIPHC